jgi:hypothetical protein
MKLVQPALPSVFPFRKDIQLTNRLFRIAVVWLLILATAWVAEPYLIAIWASANGPRTVTPRGNLTQAEQATIKRHRWYTCSLKGVSKAPHWRNSRKASFNPDPGLCGMRPDT